MVVGEKFSVTVRNPLERKGGHMKRSKAKKSAAMIGGEFMLTDGEIDRLAEGLRHNDGSPVDPIDALEFFVNALMRAGLLLVHRRSGRFYKTASAAALDANEWNRAVHRAL